MKLKGTFGEVSVSSFRWISYTDSNVCCTCVLELERSKIFFKKDFRWISQGPNVLSALICWAVP